MKSTTRVGHVWVVHAVRVSRELVCPGCSVFGVRGSVSCACARSMVIAQSAFLPPVLCPLSLPLLLAAGCWRAPCWRAPVSARSAVQKRELHDLHMPPRALAPRPRQDGSSASNSKAKRPQHRTQHTHNTPRCCTAGPVGARFSEGLSISQSHSQVSSSNLKSRPPAPASRRRRGQERSRGRGRERALSPLSSVVVVSETQQKNEKTRNIEIF